MTYHRIIFGSVLIALSMPCVSSQAAPTPVIPRKILFGNPDKAMPQISPDGKRLAYLAAVDNVLNVFVGPVDKPEQAQPVTREKTRGIRRYQWAYTSNHILYSQDLGGDENWHVYSVDLAGNVLKDLTPFESIPGPDGKPMLGPDGKPLRPAARIEAVSHKSPNDIVIGINNRDARFHDVYRVNIITGDMKLLAKNEGFAGYAIDNDYKVRLAMKFTPDGGSEWQKQDERGRWTQFARIPKDDVVGTEPEGFDKTGKILYMRDSRNRDTAALVAVSMTGNNITNRTLAEDARADSGEVLMHPTENNPLAVSFEYDRHEWRVLDRSVEADFAALRRVADGDFSIPSRTLDNQRWIAAFMMDAGPVRYYVYDRKTRKASFLFTNRKSLENVTLARMRPVVIPSRDKLNLVSYLSLPPWTDTGNSGKPDKPLPMVLLVHGGPWARDSWGFNPIHQLLANRGYAVLSVNYRGSTGLGKKFTNAGDLEWAGKMHNDLLDAVDWAVHERVTERNKVAIMGGSYGGYATLVGLTFTPDVFACGVDIVGPSNLITLLSSIPPYWKPMLDMFTTRVGDPRTSEGRRLLEERSPLTRADRIQRPLLIGQGANDPRVKQAESDQIVKALQGRNIPVTYVLFPDEGHGFQRPPNSMAFFAVTEAFLAKYLGGRFEPIGSDFNGSTITVPHGADQIAGLKDALNHK